MKTLKKSCIALLSLSSIFLTGCAFEKIPSTDLQRITYTSRDYFKNPSADTKKAAYVYLPPEYNPADTEIKYPVLYLMHGIGGDETEWGMTSNSSSIKKYMDKNIAAGKIKPFIIVTPNGRSATNHGASSDYQSFYKFGSELRNDLIPYMEANYNVIKDRDGRAMAGLSMGGMQTINIGMCECLDLISWFGAFSAAPTSYDSAKINSLITTEEFNDYEINYFYNICGTEDDIAWASHTAAAKNLPSVCEKFVAGKNFTWEQCSGGHDFNIWNKGFETFAKIAFKK